VRRFALVATAVGLWVGCFAGLRLEWSAYPWLLIMTAVTAFALLVVGRASAVVIQVGALLVCAAVVGVGLGALRMIPLRNAQLQYWAQHTLPVTALVTLADEPTSVSGYTKGSFRTPDGWRATATAHQLTTVGERMLALRVPVQLQGAGRVPSLIPGSGLSVVGYVAPTDVLRGVAVRLHVRSYVVTRAPPAWQRAIARVRLGLVAAAQVLPGDARGLLPGLTLGDTRNVPDSLTTAMKATGLTHLTAVSGGNLAVTIAIVLFLARALRASRRLQVSAALLVLGAFVLLVHAEPSVLRAAVMATVALIGFWLGRPRAAIAGLFGSLALLLLIDPWLAVSWGFALSAAATAGLLLLGAVLTRWLVRWLPHALAATIAVAIAAQVTTGPLIAALAGGVPLASVPANVLAVPFAGPATAFGLAAAVLAPIASWIALPATLCGGAAAWWIAWVARTFAGLGLPVLRFGTGAVGGLVCAAVFVVCGLAIWRWPALRARLPAVVQRGLRWWLATALALILATWWGTPAVVRRFDHWPPPNWVMVMCDVGQGDGLVLPTAPHRAIVIDVGPEPGPIDRCLADLGVNTIDLLVLTHFHADHVEGLPGALRHRAVGSIEVTGLNDPPDEAARVRAWAHAARIPVHVVVPEWGGTDGPVIWEALWPQRYLTDPNSSPANNSSIVLLVKTAGISLLLTGDAEPPAQRAIEQLWLRPNAQVLKVPHHGSSHQAPEFAAWTGAGIGLVSVGAGNPYGHPAAGTLADLAAEGFDVARTDQDGDLAICQTPQGPTLVRRRRTVVARSPS